MSTTMPAPARTGAQDLEALRAVERPGAVAVDGDRRPRQPGAAQPRRAEGRRAPGVVGVDGVDHDLAVVRGSCAPQDRVSVKPHASPVLHAINYLLGELDESYLTTLREFGGLQSYPSRAQGPGPGRLLHRARSASARPPRSGARSPAATSTAVDGGPAAPGTGPAVLAARGRRARRGRGLGGRARPDGRPSSARSSGSSTSTGSRWTGSSPTIAAARLQGMFAAAGWQVITVKYGRLLEELFARAGGAALRDRIDAMPNPEYQRLLRCTPAQLRERLPGDGPTSRRRPALIAALLEHRRRRRARAPSATSAATTSPRCSTTPSGPSTTPGRRVIFAYTVKGYGLAIEGHPQNHSALLTEAQLARARRPARHRPRRPLAAAAPGQPAGELCAADRRPAAPRGPPRAVAAPRVPADLGRTPTGTGHHPGGARPDAARPHPRRARRRPRGWSRSAPDVASSTNLGGWVNKVGVWSPARAAATGSPTTPRRSCTGGRRPPGSTSSSASPRPTWSG